MTPDTAAARALLADVRRRRARTAGVRGLAWTAAALCAAALGSFVLDWLLDLPLAVRVVHLGLVVAALVAVVWVVLVRPLRRTETDEETAATVEREVPEFQDRLVSALDFEARLRNPEEPESRDMMARTVSEASAIASRLDASLLVDGRPARRAALVALGAIGCLVATEIAAGETFALWLRRGVLLEDASWPRRTVIRVLEFAEGAPRIVTKGDDLRIVAEVTGDRPQDLDLHFEEIDDATGEVRVRDLRRLFPVPDQPGRYAFDFRAIPSSFRFWVTGGDDQDERPLYVVRALTRPGIASHSAKVEYPAYSGLPAVEIREPAIQALAGTKVTYSFTSNIPLRSARIVIGGRVAADAAGETTATEPAPDAPLPGTELALAEDKRSFRWEVTVTETADAHLVLTAIEGHTNRPEDDNYRLEVVNDRPPVIRVLYPYDRLTRTHVGLLPVKTVVEDDFGLREVRLEYHEEKTTPSVLRIWPGDTPEGPGAAEPATPKAPAKYAHVHRPLDLDQFPKESGIDLKPGDVLTVQVRATDTGSGESTSRDLVVDIATREDIHNRLTGEMNRLREDVSQARRIQRRTLAGLRELQTTVAAAPGAAADSAALGRAKDLAVDVSRSVADVVRFETGIYRVFDSYVMNRIGSEPTIQRLIPMYKEALDAAPDETGSIFPQKLYDTIVDEKRAKVIYDKDVLGILLDVMDLTNVVRLDSGPKAYDSLDRWSGAEAPKVSTAADLQTSITAGEALLAALDAIEDRMQRFQDLAEIVATLQRLRDEEDRLARLPGTSEK